MLEQRRWIRYSAKKVPLTVDGHAASSTDSSSWATHAEAAQSTAGVGIGYVLGDGIGCIDLDHCIIDGELTSAARSVVERYPGNWIEVSPSGQGLHIWGSSPEQPGTKRVIDGLSIESYSVDRYITITGNVWQAGQLRPL